MGLLSIIRKIKRKERERRILMVRVRYAFIQVQQQPDHCMFKMAPTGVRTEEAIVVLKVICLKTQHQDSATSKDLLLKVTWLSSCY
ncbi:monoglyceride lipase [Corchorus olitorius]|uniref:Monoglyceride lipase n=1 Tax=Corchorus olitorius TaxID=93759 RepID=A0A1R3HLB1_9ROSI|nr:monoglyceride lipase [Corchorus olitorius]